ncbi:MAG: MMPL family transporter [Oceanococcaceae bacterium]
MALRLPRLRADDVVRWIEPRLFGYRRAGLLILTAITLLLAHQASQIELSAGFDKQLPTNHPWMDTLRRHQDDFGGANLVSIALMARDGDMYSAAHLQKLKELTDAVFFLPGVDRSRVTSLFTPGVRYVEITENGIASGDVVPADYAPTAAMHAQIRTNVGKAGLVGRLVAENHRGAMVIAELLDHHPTTGEPLDYRAVATALEEIRARFEDDQTRVHILGFAKVVGDVSDASADVLLFFALALLLTAILLRLYCASWRLSVLPLGCSLIAVVWEFGLLHLLGFGLDPFAILVPFLVLANGVEHGIQMVNAWADDTATDAAETGQPNPLEASKRAFRQVAVPGTAALITDVLGFATIALIDIRIIQEMAINAALGMAAIIVTNKWLLPILLSYVRMPQPARYRRRMARRARLSAPVWRSMATVTRPHVAMLVVGVAGILLGYGLYKGQDLRIGDNQAGVPELRSDARYNRDAAAVVANFSIGVNVLTVYVEGAAESCIAHTVLAEIDRLVWHLYNTPGVESVQALPQAARALRAGWHEGDPRWGSLPRNQFAIVQAIGPIPGSAGLQNPDCSVMPVRIFTADHQAETIHRISETIERFAQSSTVPLEFAMAGGNVGVMGATNQVIAAKEKPVLFWVYLAVGLMCWLSYRTAGSLICVLTPLAIVSFLAYALMAHLDIGLKVATLPVTALAVGIGIDFGIYSFSVLQTHLRQSGNLEVAWRQTLEQTGKAIAFTGLALSLGVMTWMFSDLQFQRDMGVLLTFMFLANMLGALLILPALAAFVLHSRSLFEKRKRFH